MTWGTAALLHRHGRGQNGRTVEGAGRRAVEALGGASTAATTLSGVPVRRAGSLAGPARAAHAAIQRNSNLAPAGPGWKAFKKWVSATGLIYNDSEAMADDYVEMCHLMGWPLASDAAIASTPETVPEPPRAATIDVQPVAESATPPSYAPERRELAARQAAEAFVEWVRMLGKCATYTSGQISELYRQHCDEQEFVELPVKTFRPALEACEGVHRFKAEKQLHDRHGSKRRHRPTMWTISTIPAASSPTTESEDAPWIDLPRRKAA